jgi:hypothetical protein
VRGGVQNFPQLVIAQDSFTFAKLHCMKEIKDAFNTNSSIEQQFYSRFKKTYYTVPKSDRKVPTYSFSLSLMTFKLK